MRDRLIVTAAAIIWIVGTLIGTGWLGGGGVEAQGGGLFTDSTTLIAPAGPAFSIWSVIYVGLLGYVIWQWLPGNRDSAWARLTRMPAAWAIALNGVWLLVVFAGWVGMSVVVILGIAAALGVLLWRTADLPAGGWASQVWVAATFGLYLGWICVATCANIASWLVGLGVPAASPVSEAITIGVLAVVIALTVLLLTRTRQRVLQIALAAAVAWGTGWIAAGRFSGDLVSQPVAYAAAITALCVVAAGALVVLRSRAHDAAPTPLRAR